MKTKTSLPLTDGERILIIFLVKYYGDKPHGVKMSSNFRKTTSNIFLSAFIGVILVSFMLTGSSSMMSSGDEIANVGGTPIKFTEYDNELKRQMEFYKQFFGGKDLNQKQIDQYNLKTNAVNNIVARKLMGKIASEVGSHPSLVQIKKDIKSQEYFKTNDQFDITKYKALLNRVGMSPESFEKETVERLQLQNAQNVLNEFPISNTYMKEVEKLRANKRTLQIITFKKESLRKHIPVSKSEIAVYLKDEKNLDKVKGLFNSKSASLSKPEEILASHILLKIDGKNDAKMKKEIDVIHRSLTAKNFAVMANKFSQDSNTDQATKKKKGGDLGWFGKGRMVPEFEKLAFATAKGGITKPVKTQFGYHIIHIRDKKAAIVAKFEDHKNSLAKKEILFSKLSQIDKLSDELSIKVVNAFEKKSKNKLTKLKTKFSFEFTENIEANQLDGLTEENKIEDEEFQKLFEGQVGGIHTFKTPSQVTIIKVEKLKKSLKMNKEGKIEPETTLAEKKEELAKILSRKLSQNMINEKRETTKVEIYKERL